MSIPPLPSNSANLIIQNEELLNHSQQETIPVEIQAPIQKAEILSKWKWIPLNTGSANENKIFLVKRKDQLIDLSTIDKVVSFIKMIGEIVFEQYSDSFISTHGPNDYYAIGLTLKSNKKSKSKILIIEFTCPCENVVKVNIQPPGSYNEVAQNTQSPKIYEMIHAFALYYLNQKEIDTAHNPKSRNLTSDRIDFAQRYSSEAEIIDALTYLR